jgi:hypothetical protein
LHYHVIFDVTQAGYKYWWMPALCLGVAAAILVMARASKSWPVQLRGRSTSSIFAVAFFFVAGIAVFGFTFSDYLHLRHALTSGKCETIEGIVTDFMPQAVGDHAPETFTMNGRQFSYSYASTIAGFNQTRSHNGPIRTGQRLRIEVMGNEIARIEVAN